MYGLAIELTTDDVASGAHSGACDADIAALLLVPRIAEQIAKWAPDTLAAELKEYGAWDSAELADHGENCARMLWLACGDLRDQS
jgi:hypothetical protein